MLGGPTRRHAAGQHGSERCKPAHPSERFLTLTLQRFIMLGAAEECVVLDKCGLDLAVGRQCFAFRQHQLPRRFSLGQRPIDDTVLGDQAGGHLRDPRPVLRAAAERVRSVGSAVSRRMAAMPHAILA